MLKICGAVLGVSLGASGILLGFQLSNAETDRVEHGDVKERMKGVETKIEAVQEDVREVRKDIKQIQRDMNSGFRKVIRKIDEGNGG
jgi:flagellar motility protein MotE (MotC chaperone)